MRLVSYVPAAAARLVLCLAVVSTAAAAQVRPGLTAAEGLPSATVYDVAFDEAGWMWLATAAGLFRYDGTEFLPYRCTRARHGETHDLQRGPDGALYVQNFRRQVFRVSGDSLAVVADLGIDWRSYATYAALTDGLRVLVDSALFDGTPDGLRRVGWPAAGRAYAGKLHRVSPDAALVVDHVGKPRYLVNATGVSPLGSPPGTSLATVVADGGAIGAQRPRVVLHAGPRLLVAEVAAGSLRVRASLPHPTPGERLNAAAQLRDGSWLVGGPGGLWHYRRAAGWTHADGPGEVSALARAPDGTWWIATLDGGLYTLPQTPLRRRDYPEIGAGIASLAEDESGGLYAVTRAHRLVALTDSAAILRAVSYQGVDLWRARDRSLVLGVEYAIAPGEPARPLADPLTRGLSQVKAATPIGEGLVAYAAIGAVYLVGDTAAARAWLTAALPAPTRRRGARALYVLREGRSYDLAFDARARRLYVACADSLVVVEAEGARTLAADVLATTPTAVAVLPDGRLAVGTSGGGLAVLTVGTGRVPRAVRRVPEVPGREVTDVAVAADTIWIGTDGGLGRCVPGAGGAYRCAAMTAAYGLPASAPAALALGADRAHVAFGRTVYSLDRDAAARTCHAYPTYATRVEVAGERYAVDPDAPIRLEAATSSLSVSPRAPYYRSGPPTRFRYRLTPLDTQWRYAGGAAPEIYLASLPAGAYALEYGLDLPGAPTSTLRIAAALPLRRRPLAWAAAGALALAVGVAVLAQRYRRRRRELALREELRRSRLAAIAAQMNPHFVFNALNSIQDFVLGADPVGASAYLSELARLMRLTLEHSRTETVALRDEVEAMRTYVDLERLRCGDGVEVVVEVDPALDLRRRLPPLLVQPYVENAFKHGLVGEARARGRFRLSYRARGADHVEIAVEDDGIGRAAARERGRRRARFTNAAAGFGMSGTTRRIALLNEATAASVAVTVDDLYGPDGRPSGTRITLTSLLLARDPPPPNAAPPTSRSAGSPTPYPS